MRLLLPLALVLFGALTGLVVRALVRRVTGGRRGGAALPVALAAGGGAIAGLWVRDALDANALGPELGTLAAALAGSALAGLALSLASRPPR